MAKSLEKEHIEQWEAFKNHPCRKEIQVWIHQAKHDIADKLLNNKSPENDPYYKLMVLFLNELEKYPDEVINTNQLQIGFKSNEEYF